MATPAQNINDPSKTYTLDQFIDMKPSDELTYHNFSIVEVVNGVELLDHNILEDYLPELEAICQTVELSDEEFKRYKYSPDFLAYDVYGSTQLDFVILLANGMIDPKEFVYRKMKLPRKKSLLLEFLSKVYNAESGYISQNRSDNNLNIYG